MIVEFPGGVYWCGGSVQDAQDFCRCCGLPPSNENHQHLRPASRYVYLACSHDDLAMDGDERSVHAVCDSYNAAYAWLVKNFTKREIERMAPRTETPTGDVVGPGEYWSVKRRGHGDVYSIEREGVIR